MEPVRRSTRIPVSVSTNDSTHTEFKPRKRAGKGKSTIKWTAKEKKQVQSVLNEWGAPKTPDDLLRIQRYVPTRSKAEIEKWLKMISKTYSEKAEASVKMFSETNMKKWIDSCDSLTGVSSTCSDVGNGVIKTEHPALVLSDLMCQFAETDDASTEAVYDQQKNQTFDCKSIYWYFEQLLKGTNPFDEWNCSRKIESAILIELFQDVLTEINQCEFTQQHPHLFYKYRELARDKSAHELEEKPFPTDILQSRFLNPLDMTDSLIQTIELKSKAKVLVEDYAKSTSVNSPPSTSS